MDSLVMDLASCKVSPSMTHNALLTLTKVSAIGSVIGEMPVLRMILQHSSARHSNFWSPLPPGTSESIHVSIITVNCMAMRSMVMATSGLSLLSSLNYGKCRASPAKVKIN